MGKKFAFVLMALALALVLVLPGIGRADETGNMVSFRGGYAGLASGRGGEVFTDVFGNSGVRNDSTNGYYVGGALDVVLTKDVWDMLSKTWVLGEIGVEYKRWDSNVTALRGAPVLTPLGQVQRGVNLTMLTVDIAPKVKFMEGSRLRPWIIPVGLDFHVISPPSNATTVLDIGVQFGAGVEYRLYKAFHLGLDGRYHLASGATGTNNNFGTVGAYVGIAF